MPERMPNRMREDMPETTSENMLETMSDWYAGQGSQEKVFCLTFWFVRDWQFNVYKSHLFTSPTTPRKQESANRTLTEGDDALREDIKRRQREAARSDRSLFGVPNQGVGWLFGCTDLWWSMQIIGQSWDHASSSGSLWMLRILSHLWLRRRRS